MVDLCWNSWLLLRRSLSSALQKKADLLQVTVEMFVAAGCGCCRGEREGTATGFRERELSTARERETTSVEEDEGW